MQLRQLKDTQPNHMAQPKGIVDLRKTFRDRYSKLVGVASTETKLRKSLASPANKSGNQTTYKVRAEEQPLPNSDLTLCGTSRSRG
jgi:hypothetical protein